MKHFTLLCGAALLLAACSTGYSGGAQAGPVPTAGDAERACAAMGYAPGTAAFQSCYLNLLSTFRDSYVVGSG